MEPQRPTYQPSEPQPVATASVAQPQAVNAPSNFVYSSNPFRAASEGLGRALTYNPISSLSLSFLAVLFAFGILLASGLLAALLHGAGKVVVLLIAAVLIVILIIRTLAATVQIYLQSNAQTSITGREALGKYATPGIGRFLGVSLLTGLITLVGLILLVIPGLFFAGRLSLAQYVVYQEKLGVIASLKRSWQLTKGHTWEMVSALIASYIVVGGSGGLLSLIGSQAGTANRYFELTEAEKLGVSTGKTHWLNYVTPIVTALLVGGYIGLVVALGHQGFSNTTSTTPTYNSNNSYCYVSGNSFKSTCTNKTTCQNTSECATLYFNNSSSSSQSVFGH